MIVFEDKPSTKTPINAKNLNSNFAEVVESGSNENGTWIKFADGTMICRATKRLTDIVTSIPTGGNVPASATQEGIVFPATFSEKPQVEMSACRHNSWIGYEWTPPDSGEKTAGFVIYTNGPMTIAYIDIQYIAVGKWK